MNIYYCDACHYTNTKTSLTAAWIAGNLLCESLQTLRLPITYRLELKSPGRKKKALTDEVTIWKDIICHAENACMLK